VVEAPNESLCRAFEEDPRTGSCSRTASHGRWWVDFRAVVMNFTRKLIPVFAALSLAATVSACGSEEKVSFGINEGAYVDVGDIAYQVQISRVLNPKLPEDPSYLVGLPAGTPDPAPREKWFAVFLRAQNYGSKPAPVETKFRIIDTEGTKYMPFDLDPQINTFAWNPTGLLNPDFVYPDVSSVAGTGPVRQGGELLFKIKDSVYQNRPLVFEILDAAGKPAASVDLDL